MQAQFRANFLPILIIILVAFFASVPLLAQGLHVIHDDQQVARLFLYDEALKSGQFPVRWINGLGFGFGYPLFVFYPPAVYFLGEVFHLFGFSFISSVKLVFFSSILLSGVAMYFFTNRLWGRMAGLVSATFYMLVPYRALDIYVRGALAESLAFIFPPLILLYFYEITISKKNANTILAAIFLAGLMISHNLIFLPFLLPLMIYSSFLIFESKEKRRVLTTFLITIIFSLMLSAFYWLPSLLEKKYTLVDQLLLTDKANYQIHFAYLDQLWYSPWQFGGSVAGPNDGLSFRIGKIHIISALLAFIVAMGLLIKVKNSKQILSKIKLTITLFTLLILSAFMTTNYSQAVWTLLPQLAYLQFPWRFLLLCAVFSSALAGALIYHVKLPILRTIFAILLLSVVLYTDLKLFKPQFQRITLTDISATSKEVISWDVSKTSFEYMPKQIQVFTKPDGTRSINLSKDQLPQNRLELISGSPHVTIINDKPQVLSFIIDSTDSSIMRANITNFPGWTLKIDNRVDAINDNNPFKLIEFNVPEGSHRVELNFKNTIPVTVGNYLSIMSLAIILGLYIYKKKITNGHV